MAIEVIYQFSDIKGRDDMRRRGIEKDLLCHLLGYAKAYATATRTSKNPLDYMSHSGHLYEVASVKELMDVVQSVHQGNHKRFLELFMLLAEHTDEMMLAVEAHALELFFIDHEKRHDTINGMIDTLVVDFAKNAQLDSDRIDAICRDSLAKNEPAMRIRRLLQATKKP